MLSSYSNKSGVRYDYKCEKCHKTVEKKHGMNDEPSLKCECGGSLVKKIGVVNTIDNTGMFHKQSR